MLFRSGKLEGLEKGVEVKICGVLTGIQRKRNKEQRLWASMQLEDRNGSVDALCFATAYEKLSAMVVEDKPLLVYGLVLPEEGAPPKLSVQDIIPLEVARVPMPGVISIRVWLGRNGIEKADALKELFARKPGDTSVRFKLDMARDFSVLLDVPAKVRPDREFRAEIERICGEGAIETIAS